MKIVDDLRHAWRTNREGCCAIGNTTAFTGLAFGMSLGVAMVAKTLGGDVLASLWGAAGLASAAWTGFKICGIRKKLNRRPSSSRRLS